MKTLTKTLLATSTSLLALGSVNLPAQAAVLIGNFSSTNDLINTTTVIGGSISARAYSFTTGSQTYDLSSIDLRLSFDASGSKNPLITINSNASGEPSSTALATLSTTGAGLGLGTFATYNYTTTPFTFAANTTYWLQVATVLAAGGTGTNIYWGANGPASTDSGINPTSDFSPDVTPGSYIRNSVSNTTPPLGWAANPAAQKNSFQINTTTAVPEPLTILGAATAAGFGGLFKRRLAKAKK